MPFEMTPSKLKLNLVYLLNEFFINIKQLLINDY